jgi:hypothetical protein
MFTRLAGVTVVAAAAVACSGGGSDDARNGSPIAPTSVPAMAAASASSTAFNANHRTVAQGHAAAASETSTSVEHFETTGGFVNPCNGDVVDVEAVANIVFHTTLNGDHVILEGLHQTDRATGTSQTAGTKYV